MDGNQRQQGRFYQDQQHLISLLTGHSSHVNSFGPIRNHHIDMEYMTTK
jgi:hypothetical protein